MFSNDDWKASHQYESNQITNDTDFERQVSNKLKLRDLTKPYYRSHASDILSDYNVGIWKRNGQLLPYCIWSLRITPISLLSSSIMDSGLTYFRSVEYISTCPLSRSPALLSEKWNLHQSAFEAIWLRRECLYIDSLPSAQITDWRLICPQSQI
jgi:hypothetical protein